MLARHIADLTPIATDELPPWLHQLPLPPRWRLAQFDGSPTQPARMAVCGPHPAESWNGCDTVSLFRFTGTPSEGLVLDTSDRMLRDLGAEAITTYPLSIPPAGRVAAVRSSGDLSVAGQHIWLQYSTYLAGSELPGAGVLIEHGVFVHSTIQASLHDDITELTNGIHLAFVNSIAAASEQNVHAAVIPYTVERPPLEGSAVATFRVGFFPDFKWDDVVLVGADRDGLRIFRSALRSAHQNGEGSFELHGIQHRVVRQNGAADIELGSPNVVWRFDNKKLVEILDMVVGLIRVEHPAHNYFDGLNSPVETLMISVDEYVSGGPFSQFPQGLPVPRPEESQGPTTSSGRS